VDSHTTFIQVTFEERGEERKEELWRKEGSQDVDNVSHDLRFAAHHVYVRSASAAGTIDEEAVGFSV
jgi:hypothetical protein